MGVVLALGMVPETVLALAPERALEMVPVMVAVLALGTISATVQALVPDSVPVLALTIGWDTSPNYAMTLKIFQNIGGMLW